jgi:hypothetical protein
MKTFFSSRVLFQGGLVIALAMGFVGCLTDDKGDEDSGPTISIGPTTQIVAEGATATYTVIASGTGDLDYQWTLNGTDLEGRTSASLNIVARDSIDNATIRVKVTDDNGTTTSDPAYLRIAVDGRTVTLGAQGNTIASSWDADVPVTYNASTAPNHSNDIDVVFAYSTSTGNDSLALYSPSVAKNGLGGGSNGFDFMSTWPTANSIEIRRVDVADWDNVMTAADIENLFANGSAGATPGRIFVRVGTTVVIKTNLNKYVLMRVTVVTIQSENGTGTITAKAKW